MKIPKLFEKALAGRTDTIWFDHDPGGREIARIKETGAGLFLKQIHSGRTRVIQMSLTCRIPTHPHLTETVFFSATGKGVGYQLDENDEPALAKLLNEYERLMTRNQAMELALERGQSAAFGYLVHPALLLRPQACEETYQAILRRDGRVMVEGQRIVQFGWACDTYSLHLQRSAPATMRIPGHMPETVREGIMSKQHVPLSALVNHDYPRKIHIRKISEVYDRRFKTSNGAAIELQFETDFVRLAPVPPEYAGDWNKPKPGKRY